MYVVNMPQENLKKVVIDDIEWERTNFGVVTKEKMGSSYKSFTHGELAQLAICSGLVEFLGTLGYQLGKLNIKGL
jgi:hypothetical protein